MSTERWPQPSTLRAEHERWPASVAKCYEGFVRLRVHAYVGLPAAGERQLGEERGNQRLHQGDERGLDSVADDRARGHCRNKHLTGVKISHGIPSGENGK